MSAMSIRLATASDVARLDDALRRLSAAIGDEHRADAQLLLSAGFGERPSFSAVLAEKEETLAGVAVFSPIISTMRGKAGVYLSDLWVEPGMRGSGLGKKLLSAALAEARELYGAEFIKLAVYHNNPRALRFYERLGFEPSSHEMMLVLNGAKLDQVGD
jgi:ribosomal protein S18 acetylase RimI-like enzyme